MPPPLRRCGGERAHGTAETRAYVWARPLLNCPHASHAPFARHTGLSLWRHNSALYVCVGGGGAKDWLEKGCEQGCIGRGGGTPRPLQGVQPMPSHCPPDAKCQPQWHL